MLTRRGMGFARARDMQTGGNDMRFTLLASCAALLLPVCTVAEPLARAARAAAGPQAALDPASITVRELGTFGDRSSAASINNQGWIGGTTNRFVGDDDDFAAIWSPEGTLLDANPGGTLFSWVADIAPNGVALVSAVAGQEDVDAYTWTPTGGAQKVVGLSARAVTGLGGINSQGEIVGTARDANGEDQGFHWGASGFTLLSLTSVVKAEAHADDINDDALIGATARVDENTSRAFIGKPGAAFTDIGVAGWSYASVSRLSELGHAVGFGYSPGRSHTFFWTAPGGLVVLEPPTGYFRIDLVGVNGRGHAVGAVSTGDPSGDRPIFWSAATGIVPLPLPPGWSRGVAWAINDRGQIVGSAQTPARLDRALVWDLPAPPPDLAAVELLDQVEMLLDTGAIGMGDADALTAMLRASAGAMARDNATAAINTLEAFIHHLEVLVSGGELTAAQAEPLILAAQQAIAELGGG
jgi:hypothetical protein